MTEEKLYTIDELMEGKAPGSVKIARANWDRGTFFSPYYKDKYKRWTGPDEEGVTWHDEGTYREYKFYSEPKKKKVLRPAIYRSALNSLSLTTNLYESIEEAQVDFTKNKLARFICMAPDSYAVEIEE